MSEKIHSVKYNFIMNFILTATQFIFPLITFPYVARVLLPAGNGRVSFAASIANYFLMVASLGIPTYGIRACAVVRDDKEKLSKTVQEIFIINLVSTILVSIAYFVSILIIPRFTEDRVLYIINSFNIVLSFIGMNWVFQALEQYDYITFRSIAFKIISVVLMFVFVHKESDYAVYSAITVFAAVGSNLFNFYRITKIISFKKFSDYDFKKHLKPIFILFAQSLAISIYTNLDTVMLGFLNSDVEVGYYDASVKIKNILVMLATSLGSVLLPRMSYYYKNNNREKFMDTMAKALNFTTMISIPLVVFFIIFAKEGILFIADGGYINAVPVLRIVVISIIPIGITGVLGVQVLTPMEKEKFVLYSVIAGAISDFVLNLFFIRQYGAVGAAFATTVAEMAVLFFQAYCLRGMLMPLFNKLRSTVYLLTSCFCAIVVIFLKGRFTLPLFFELLINAIVFFSLYGIGLLVFREELLLQIIDELKEKVQNVLKNKNE